jgi:serine-type D-Ala-D-Ala carboxypeptidase/endopeptidase (penicillin-binding protein 4)
LNDFESMATKINKYEHMKIFLTRFFLAVYFLTIHIIFCHGQINQKLVNSFLNDTVIRTGIVGISIYEPATKKYVYNYNEEKNFVPSSNTKLFTLYAGLKYLGDSLLAANMYESHDSIYFQPTGDPTFLHKDFKKQPLLDLLKSKNKKICYVPFWNDKFQKWGSGWSWNDYGDYYMAERNRFPIYGNVWSVFLNENKLTSIPPNIIKNGFFEELAPSLNFGKKYLIVRDLAKNKYRFESSDENFTPQEIPFITDELGIFNPLQLSLLKDALSLQNDSITFILNNNIPWKKFYSQPVDSMFRPMMYRSDNFFAEQTLLMVSNKKLGFMSDQLIIDSLLKTDLKEIPTKPIWVDGSGLSRYNLFSPKNFIFILEKLRNEFGINRMKNLLPTGGQGTLTNYYVKDAGFIYAKTGSMGGHVALSGYLFTKNNKMLEFSVIINNFIGSGRAARRAIEQLLQQIRINN